MTEKEAIDVFEKAHTLKEQWELENDIQDISNILSQRPINMCQVKAKIDKVNNEHQENVIINHIIFPPQRAALSGGYDLNQSFIDDLIWKRIYLQAKKAGKLFDEFCKEMRNGRKESGSKC